MQGSPFLSSPFLNPRSSFFDFHTPYSSEASEPLIVIEMEPDPYKREGESEFTFANCTGQPCSSPVPADKIFLNGQIRPSHPFKLPEAPRTDGEPESRPQKRPMREPLRRLFSQEREWNSSSWRSGSYEEGELEDLPAEMYCVWRPNAAREEKRVLNVTKTNKKKSDGCGDDNMTSVPVSTSKRWKVKDLVCGHGSKKVRDEP